MIPHQPESSSEILRATHILLVQFERVVPGLKEPGGDFIVKRKVQTRLRVERMLKGRLAEENSQHLDIVLTVFKNEGARFTALPGVWSRHELAEGGRFVLFSIAGSDLIGAVVPEPQCFRCEPAATALPEVERALVDESPGPSLDRLLARRGGERGAFGPLFARYVGWRLREVVTPRTFPEFDAVMSEVENPQTSSIFQRLVVSEAYDIMMLLDPVPNGFLARLIWGSVRLLATEAGVDLRELVLQTLLPNLVALEGGLVPKRASEVFAENESQLRDVTDIIRTRTELPGREPLMDWLGT